MSYFGRSTCLLRPFNVLTSADQRAYFGRSKTNSSDLLEKHALSKRSLNGSTEILHLKFFAAKVVFFADNPTYTQPNASSSAFFRIFVRKNHTTNNMHSKEEKLEAFGKLLDVLDELRIKCPWDHKQTNESLRPNTIEEVYELCDAIERNDVKDEQKELGDVLLHICFYAKIAQEKAQFDIADVCRSLVDKLIYRHPHIYGKTQASTAEAVADNWEKLKEHEKGGNKTVLSGVPKSLPSLIKSFRIQEKAAHVGFDWEKKEDVWQKVKEEIQEYEEAAKSGSLNASEAEFGDLLFSLVNAARLYGINPDNALELTNRKFISRFGHIEQSAKAAGKKVSDLSLEDMDKFWNEAKNIEKQTQKS